MAASPIARDSFGDRRTGNGSVIDPRARPDNFRDGRTRLGADLFVGVRVIVVTL